MLAKPKRRTRERILETALAQFNTHGEPTVTTAAIALEMGISPGNLYYHYHSKEKIVEDLFAAFRAEIEETLAAPQQRLPDAEDCWLFLHLVFEAIWKYRFLYRDLNELIARYRCVETQMKRILAHKIRVGREIMAGLVKAGQMTASAGEIGMLAENMALVATYWLSFEFARNPRAPQDGRGLGRGVFQVLALAAPHLGPRERALFDDLATRYAR
ncbi:MAG TPA: TetR/AcrR family transcriptional regulator [Rhodoblastus sp.]|nr:TetR/AcrR family transcriptional regulator [Rhodoblastus sp.]